MSYLVFLYASGWAFFVGAGMIVAALLLPCGCRRWAKLLVGVGAIVFVAPPSTPLPWIGYVFLALMTLFWWRPIHGVRNIRQAVVSCWLVAIVFELINQQTMVKPNRVPSSISLAVIGDSLTSGLSETKAVNWPKLLRDRYEFGSVYDFAVEGATCRKALLQAERIPVDANVVVLAIGGNDILGQSTLAEFERDYDALLAKASGHGRKLVSFELPLPPFHNGWGSSQREIARRHGAWLIPKWRLMWVLADPKNTVDSIHPTQAGQDALADLVASIVLP